MSIDLQINGYAGTDFNAHKLAPAALHHACQALHVDGVSQILATVITDQTEVMVHRLQRLAELRDADPLAQRIIAGFHIEGPFISPEPGYVGAHPVQAVQTANKDVMQTLLEAAGGLTRIVTLAPEHDPGYRVTQMLSDQSIVVAAGHCNPTVQQLHGALDHGLSMFTHLGNGCPMLLHRHDNIIQRVLHLAERLWISFIADGAHVPWPALGNYLRRVGPERAIIVTDAISAAGQGPGTFSLGDQTVAVGDDGVVWSADRTHFVGSAGTMPQARNALRQHLCLDDTTLDKLLIHNPQRLLEISASPGKRDDV